MSEGHDKGAGPGRFEPWQMPPGQFTSTCVVAVASGKGYFAVQPSLHKVLSERNEEKDAEHTPAEQRAKEYFKKVYCYFGGVWPRRICRGAGEGEYCAGPLSRRNTLR